MRPFSLYSVDQMADDSTAWVGRAAALVAFWGVIVYLTVALLFSLLTQLYGGSPTAGAYRHNWCVAQVVGLERELEDRSLEVLERSLKRQLAAESWPAWHRAWDTRLRRADDACRGEASLADVFSDLSLLGASYDREVRHATEVQSTVGVRLDARLRDLIQARGVGEPMPRSAAPTP